jgi:hypothetical protein
MSNCKLANLGPVCCDNPKSKSHSRKPDPELFSDIPLLWQILGIVVSDWRREIAPLQKAIDTAGTESEKLYHFSRAFFSLQPHYLKCLFSYSVFFVALEGAYGVFYTQLNELNRRAFFNCTHRKPPNRTNYTEKVRLIRNISLVHMGSNEEDPVTSAAAMMWQPLTASKKQDEEWDLDKITFGGFKRIARDAKGNTISQSRDLEIRGTSELETECRRYLLEYDTLCSDYLKAIHAKLPITVGDEEYSELKLPVITP